MHSKMWRPFLSNCDDNDFKLIKIRNPVFQMIRIFSKINRNRICIQKCPAPEKFIYTLCTWSPLRFYHSINAVTAISLWHCCFVTEGLRPTARLYFRVGCFSSPS